jgi:predicted Zn-dependent protease with MMP-like domain
MHDHNPQQFIDHIRDVVTQIADIDHLNLFITSLR